MSEDLQSLLEKINRDGVEKAQAQAEAIIAEAKAKAAAIVKEAGENAAKAKVEAEDAARNYAERAKETIKQAARDTVIEVKAAITARVERLLARDVAQALGDEATAGGLVAEAVKGMAGDIEISAPANLAQMLRAQLAGKGGFTVTIDETRAAGFTVKLDGGRIEHSFTGEAIAGELARRLRPDLSALLR